MTTTPMRTGRTSISARSARSRSATTGRPGRPGQTGSSLATGERNRPGQATARVFLWNCHNARAESGPDLEIAMTTARVLTVAMMLSVVALPAMAAAPNGWKTYTDARAGWSISYPANFTVDRKYQSLTIDP